MQFDAREVKLLPEGAVLLFDGYPGLRMSVSKNKRAWIYRYKSPVDGRMRQCRIGVWPAMSHLKAAVEWEALRALRNSGQDPVLMKRKIKADSKQEVAKQNEEKRIASFTIKQLCDLYLEGHIKPVRTPKGYDYVKSLFQCHLADINSVPVRDITLAQAYGKIEGIAVERGAPVAAKNVRLELAAALSYAKEKGMIPREVPNWWREINEGQSLKAKLKSKGKKVGGKHVGRARRTLTGKELSVLIPWLPNFSQSVNDALTVYLWTGARGAEIVQLEGREVAEEDDGILWWTCPKAKTKNRHHDFATDFRVPLFSRAREVVLRRKERYGDGYLWPSRQNTKLPYMEQESIGNRVREHQPRNAGIKKNYAVLPVADWSPHDLRRTVRTLLSSLGCPRAVGEQVLGHVPEGIVGVYDRYMYDMEKVEWLKRLSDHLDLLAAR